MRSGAHCPFVQWQDTRLWILEWWFESTRGNRQPSGDALAQPAAGNGLHGPRQRVTRSALRDSPLVMHWYREEGSPPLGPLRADGRMVPPRGSAKADDPQQIGEAEEPH